MVDNIASTFDRLASNRSNRAMPRIVWRWPLAATAVVVAIVFLAIDPLAGAHRLPAHSLLFQYGLATTHWAKTVTILIPAALVLLASALVDWRALRPRARLLWLQWTSLAGYLLVSVLLTELVVAMLKQAIGRARPSIFPEVGAYHFEMMTFHHRYASFPSGHAGTAGCVAMAVALLFPRLRVPAAIVAVWLALTRVFVGAHYPADIIAGFALGAWIAYAMALVCARHGILFDASASLLPRRRRAFHLWPWSTRARFEAGRTWRGGRGAGATPAPDAARN